MADIRVKVNSNSNIKSRLGAENTINVIPSFGLAGKRIYYQSGDFSTNGVSYFDSAGLLKSTVAPGSGISTSNYILTTDSSGVPTWTDTIDGGTF